MAKDTKIITKWRMKFSIFTLTIQISPVMSETLYHSYNIESSLTTPASEFYCAVIDGANRYVHR